MSTAFVMIECRNCGTRCALGYHGASFEILEFPDGPLVVCRHCSNAAGFVKKVA